MEALQLIATGGALPSRIVTNEEMSRLVDTSDDWITSRTGIRRRHFCAEGESAATLAVAAARQALARSGVAADQIGCCLCATLSGDYATPSLACLVQAALGLPQNIPVLDVNAACSGFLYAVAAARGLLAQTGGRYALVIGCEQLSRLLDMTDRNTCVLFGDGAGAAVLQMAAAPFALTLGARGDKAIVAEGPGPLPSRVQMDGKAVFRFAVEAIPRCVNELLAQSGAALDAVDWVVCHQANERIIDHSIKKLGASPQKFFKNLDHTGNTSAASIPLALNELWETGRLRPGQTLLCVGFGGGLTWAGVLMQYQGGTADEAAE
ncbi:MAG: beta-ketoacyl-ACP synthase III [Gemmiger sp.]